MSVATVVMRFITKINGWNRLFLHADTNSGKPKVSSINLWVGVTF